MAEGSLAARSDAEARARAVGRSDLGKLTLPEDRAMARVLHDFAIAPELLDLLLEGLSWDADGRRFTTGEQLHDYAARVSGAPALMLCLIMGRRRRAVLERACDLAVGAQLTRICRDVGADAARGRVYLPLEWLEEGSVDADALLDAPRISDELREVIKRARKAADAALLRADPGIAALPFDCRPFVRGSRYIYAGILSELERRRYDSISERVRLSWPRKIRLLSRAVRPSRSEQRPLESATQAAHAPLVGAVVIE